ncbi:hypothetical protein ACIRSU_16765 [Streptomyces sp. NPDC101160]|uniref:hypothetical protein n=1 Tax=Streptomyces sp. NPDC101160 TaxID=3366118 RepID=UPI003814A6B8
MQHMKPMRVRPDADDAEPPVTAHDTTWAGEARTAAGCAGLLLAALLVVDAVDGGLETWSVALWVGLAVLLLVILLPARVSAAPGRLSVRGLWTRHTVRTDRLASVRWSNGVAQRLVLRDKDGGRAELDPQVLVDNPPLWQLVSTAARTSLRDGTLLCGQTALHQMQRRIDRETAERVFRVSGL